MAGRRASGGVTAFASVIASGASACVGCRASARAEGVGDANDARARVVHPEPSRPWMTGELRRLESLRCGPALVSRLSARHSDFTYTGAGIARPPVEALWGAVGFNGGPASHQRCLVQWATSALSPERRGGTFHRSAIWRPGFGAINRTTAATGSRGDAAAGSRTLPAVATTIFHAEQSE